jgi:outer membrane immunogenic protein
MRKFTTASLLALALAGTAHAQTTTMPSSDPMTQGTMSTGTMSTGTMSASDANTAPAGSPTTPAGDPAAPDGTPAYGIEPYFGIMGGYHDFDRGNKGALQLGNSANGWLAGGYAGVNIPLGAFVVGAEGNIAKGFNDIDYEYGVTGHVGVRAGDSGMIFARAGYHWINAKRGFANDRNEIYGFGVEVGPKNLGLGGITGNSGARLRFAIDTFDDFQSIRPTVGLTFHF